MKVRKIGNIYGFNGTGTSYAGNVYDISYLSPNISGMEGGNRQPMIVDRVYDVYNDKLREDNLCGSLTSNSCTSNTHCGTFAVIVAERGRNPDNPSDRRGGIPLEQRLEPNREGICNCLTQLYKDNLVMETVRHICNVNPSGKGQNGSVIDSEGLARTVTVEKGEGMKILIKQNNKQGYAECKIGGVADLSYPDSKTRRGRVQGGGDVSPALTVTDLGGISRIESKYRIRKLTPLECWRLMGFTDEEFKAAESVNSNTQLYKQAGNSIVVDVLVGIFRNIIDAMEVDDMRTKTAEVEVVETDKMIDLAKFREAEPELFDELVADYPGTKGNYLFCVGD
jgi:DNA (cytosine-5)-methyltransferase 1